MEEKKEVLEIEQVVKSLNVILIGKQYKLTEQLLAAKKCMDNNDRIRAKVELELYHTMAREYEQRVQIYKKAVMMQQTLERMQMNAGIVNSFKDTIEMTDQYSIQQDEIHDLMEQWNTIHDLEHLENDEEEEEDKETERLLLLLESQDVVIDMPSVLDLPIPVKRKNNEPVLAT